MKPYSKLRCRRHQRPRPLPLKTVTYNIRKELERGLEATDDIRVHVLDVVYHLAQGIPATRFR